MPKRYYTAGYLGHTIEELEAERKERNALVVDIRIRPLSRVPMWRQKAMMRFFGADYLWCEPWGSPTFKQGPPHHLADPEAGWEIVKPLTRDVILLCACRDYETCHRHVLADWLRAEHGIVTEELEW